MSNSDNNKRIAKNTLMLYFRMLITMGVGLFTSRVVLQTLGVEDYGIYSVVGGIVYMFTFFNGGMVAATQRYLNFELGRGNQEQLSKVFSTSIQIHALISLIVFLLSETVGIWFLYEKLVIPADRLNAAFWVFQFSIVACVVNIILVPYNAVIVAHEKMSAFAYMSILDVILKLFIVYLLYVSPWDRLVVYSALLLFVCLLMYWIYVRYCQKHFPEAHYRHYLEKPLLKELLSFSGWSLLGNFAVMLYSQGLNLMLNIFFGPLVNAARGIAAQVQGAVCSLSSNFQMAVNPNITKEYASGNIRSMHNLMFRSSKFSFILLYSITLPVILETDFILMIWLKTVPPDTVVFTRWIIFISLLFTTINPCVIAAQATGNIKKYQIVVGCTLLLILPCSYILLNFGGAAYSVFIVHLCIEIIAQCLRLYMLRKLIELSIIEYLSKVYLRIIVLAIISCAFPIYVQSLMPEGFQRFVIVFLTSVISVVLVSFYIGLTKCERIYLYEQINKMTRKILRRH